MTSRKLLLVALAVLLVGGIQAVNAQQQEANQAHAALKKSHYGPLGFPTKAALDASTLGTPHRVYMIGVDDVVKFKRGDNPRNILHDSHELIYPINSGGKHHTSLSLHLKKGKWVHTAIGSSEIHIVEPARKKQVTEKGKAESAFVVVKIPAMYVTYLGYLDKNQLYLVPAHKHEDLTFTLHVGLPAEQVLLALQPHARKYESPRKK